MWPLFNIVQLLLCFVVFDLPFPANVNFIFKLVKDSLELNFIPKEEIINAAKDYAKPAAD